MYLSVACVAVRTELKDLQGQREKARPGRVVLVLARGRAHVLTQGQQEQEGHPLPKLTHLVSVDAELLSLQTNDTRECMSL